MIARVAYKEALCGRELYTSGQLGRLSSVSISLVTVLAPMFDVNNSTLYNRHIARVAYKEALCGRELYTSGQLGRLSSVSISLVTVLAPMFDVNNSTLYNRHIARVAYKEALCGRELYTSGQLGRLSSVSISLVTVLAPMFDVNNSTLYNRHIARVAYKEALRGRELYTSGQLGRLSSSSAGDKGLLFPASAAVTATFNNGLPRLRATRAVVRRDHGSLPLIALKQSDVEGTIGSSPRKPGPEAMSRKAVLLCLLKDIRLQYKLRDLARRTPSGSLISAAKFGSDGRVLTALPRLDVTSGLSTSRVGGRYLSLIVSDSFSSQDVTCHRGDGFSLWGGDVKQLLQGLSVSRFKVMIVVWHILNMP
ncbi:hypothetical protein J6590_052497 [Homalodisca vitripennis]|nr:hypothetical protein J6590_052497 [Homalodisca vitripennis]